MSVQDDSKAEFDVDSVLEDMRKRQAMLRKHIKDDDSEKEKKEKYSADGKKYQKIESAKLGRREMDEKLRILTKEAPRFKFIPDPDIRGDSDETFTRNIQDTFSRVLPKETLKKLTNKACGLCSEEFEANRWAWRHFTGYNHKGALKSFLRGTFQIHPPYFKMVWEAVLAKNPEPVSDIQIFVYIMQKFNVGEDIKKIEQFIQFGTERLLANDYIKKLEGGMFSVVDPERALDIKSGAPRVPNKETREAIEAKIEAISKPSLPSSMVATLKVDYCGLCHVELREDRALEHYRGSGHLRLVDKFREGKYRGHPSYFKMVEQYFASENPSELSEGLIADFILSNFKGVSSEVQGREVVMGKVQRVLAAILEGKPASSSRDRAYH